MPDDRQEPGDAPADGGTEPRSDATPDETASLRRPDETASLRRPDETAPQRQPDETAPQRQPDETAPQRRSDETAPQFRSDETAQQRRPDETVVRRRVDETVPQRRLDGVAPSRRRADDTARLPAAERAATPGVPKPWLGRAEVPPPRVAEVREAVPGEWEGGGERQYRPWWMPIFLGIVALFVLAVLGLGVWLIAEADRNAPAPVLPAPSVTGPPSPTTAPTTVASTTGEPTASATTGGTVPVPVLVGLPEATAREMLDEIGLTYRLEFRASSEPPDTVIETDPSAGTLIDSGEQVTLVIAEAPASTPTAATPSAPVRPSPTG